MANRVELNACELENVAGGGVKIDPNSLSHLWRR